MSKHVPMASVVAPGALDVQGASVFLRKSVDEARAIERKGPKR